MLILLQFALILAVFLAIRYAAYYITDVKGLPIWLDYKPFNCCICLTFWSLLTTYLAIWLSFSCLYVGIGGILLACMNALAMYIDQKQKTIHLDV